MHPPTRRPARRSPRRLPLWRRLRQRVEHNSRAILSKKDGSRSSIREVVSPILNEKGEFSGSVIVFQDFTDARALAAAARACGGARLADRAGKSLEPARDDVRTARRRRSRGAPTISSCSSTSTTSRRSTTQAATPPATSCSSRSPIRSRRRRAAGDVAARLGGDEFAVILRNCGVESGTAMAERLIAAMAGLTPARFAGLRLRSQHRPDDGRSRRARRRRDHRPRRPCLLRGQGRGPRPRQHVEGAGRPEAKG